ncbi:Major facilitator super domain-containing protein 7 [Cladochytrium tenue]|nr:Major facilitator super domain-containing protein 7 [Cladochytrium tenue]
MVEVKAADAVVAVDAAAAAAFADSADSADSTAPMLSEAQPTPLEGAAGVDDVDSAVAKAKTEEAQVLVAEDGAAPDANEPEFKVYRTRFLAVTTVFLANVSNALIWSTYVAVTPTTAAYYNTSNWNINLVSLIFTAVFVVFILPAMWVIDNWGVRTSLLFGSWVTALGAAIRALSYFAPAESRLAVLYVGQIVAGIAQPFLLDVPTKTAAVWFPSKERLTANTVMNLGQPIGTAIASLVAPGVVTDASDTTAIDLLNVITFGVALVFAVPSIFVKARPPTPPSKSASVQSTSFWVGLKRAVANRYFMLLAFSYALLLSCFNTFTTFASTYLTPYGYSETDSGNTLVIIIVVGIVTAGVVGVIMDRIKQHRLALKIISWVLFIGVLLYYFACAPDRYGLLYAACVVIGLGAIPVMALSLELGVECLHPVAEGTTSGIMWCLACALTVGFTFASYGLTDPDGDMKRAIILLLALLACSAVLLLFYNVANRRIMFESSTDKQVDDDTEFQLTVLEATEDSKLDSANKV